MKNLFKAIELINKSSIDRTLKEGVISDIREVIDGLQKEHYFLPIERLERLNKDYKYYGRDKWVYPYYRAAKNGQILQLNKGYYLNSIKKALESGWQSDLKEKEFYYEIDDSYYSKSDYWLYEGKCYSKKDYNLIDGKLIDKSLMSTLYFYPGSGDTIAENYTLESKPRYYKTLALDYENTTEAYVRITMSGLSHSAAICNSFKFDGSYLTMANSSSMWIWGKRYYSDNVFIPIEHLDKFKFEIPKCILDAVERIEKKAPGFQGLKELTKGHISISLVNKRSNKKFRIIKDALEKAGWIKLDKLECALKMIKDIMEVK